MFINLNRIHQNQRPTWCKARVTAEEREGGGGRGRGNNVRTKPLERVYKWVLQYPIPPAPRSKIAMMDYNLLNEIRNPTNSTSNPLREKRSNPTSGLMSRSSQVKGPDWPMPQNTNPLKMSSSPPDRVKPSPCNTFKKIKTNLKPTLKIKQCHFRCGVDGRALVLGLHSHPFGSDS